MGDVGASLLPYSTKSGSPLKVLKCTLTSYNKHTFTHMYTHTHVHIHNRVKKISEQSVAEVAVRMLENETLEVRSPSTEKYKRAAMDCGKYKCKCIAATVESSSAIYDVWRSD